MIISGKLYLNIYNTDSKNTISKNTDSRNTDSRNTDTFYELQLLLNANDKIFINFNKILYFMYSVRNIEKFIIFYLNNYFNKENKTYACFLYLSFNFFNLSVCDYLFDTLLKMPDYKKYITFFEKCIKFDKDNFQNNNYLLKLLQTNVNIKKNNNLKEIFPEIPTSVPITYKLNSELPQLYNLSDYHISESEKVISKNKNIKLSVFYIYILLEKLSIKSVETIYNNKLFKIYNKIKETILISTPLSGGSEYADSINKGFSYTVDNSEETLYELITNNLIDSKSNDNVINLNNDVTYYKIKDFLDVPSFNTLIEAKLENLTYYANGKLNNFLEYLKLICKNDKSCVLIEKLNLNFDTKEIKNFLDAPLYPDSAPYERLVNKINSNMFNLTNPKEGLLNTFKEVNENNKRYIKNILFVLNSKEAKKYLDNTEYIKNFVIPLLKRNITNIENKTRIPLKYILFLSDFKDLINQTINQYFAEIINKIIIEINNLTSKDIDNLMTTLS